MAGLFSDLSVLSIIVFIAGIVLMVIEVFHPGFGAAGIGGVICFIIGIIITADTFAEGMLLAAILFVLVALLLMLSAYLVSKGHLPSKLVLTDANDTKSGFSGVEDMQYLLGKEGKAITMLRPAGMADFDGVRLDVVTRGDYIEAGTGIEVVEVESNRIVVREKSPETAVKSEHWADSVISNEADL